MTLSAFAAFYEGYASIEPFVQGWSKYFQLRKQTAQEPRDKNAPPKTAKEKKERPMTQYGAAINYVLERLRLSKDRATGVMQEMVEDILLCEEYHNCGSNQPAGVRRRPADGNEELDL
jgi:hypothetical protein